MGKRRKLNRGVAVVGAGMSSFGVFDNRDSKDLFAEAFTEMILSVDKGLDPADIQFSEVHDCFSIAELVHIEDLGFFKPGQGFKAVADGATGLEGSMPINTSGGLKCKGHPVGATGVSQLYEVWTQLRRKAGKRQVPKPNLRIGAAHNLGGTGGTVKFQEKVVLITGGAAGIGLATAEAFAAEAYLFLAPEAASFITGEVLQVDGGLVVGT